MAICAPSSPAAPGTLLEIKPPQRHGLTSTRCPITEPASSLTRRHQKRASTRNRRAHPGRSATQKTRRLHRKLLAAALVPLLAHRERRSAREKSDAPIAASSLTFRMSWSIRLHGLGAGVAHAQTLPAVGRGSSMRSEVREVRCRRAHPEGTGNGFQLIVGRGLVGRLARAVMRRLAIGGARAADS